MSEKEKDIVKSSSDKSGKPGFMQRVKKFFKEYRGELKKISWPTMAEVVKNTMITLAAVLMIGVVIWIFDFAVTSLRDAVIAIDKTSGSDVSASDVVTDPVTSGADALVLSSGDALSVSDGDVSSTGDAGAEG